jgi:CRISP-associated protein Cas1
MWRVTVCLFDWTGKLLGTFIPYASSADPGLQIAQMEASRNPKKALKIAREIVAAKSDRMLEAAREWGDVADLERIHAAHPITKVRSVKEARAVESWVTEAYWDAFRFEIKRRWPEARFKVRGHPTHGYKMRAVEPVNAALNYAYSLLEAKARTNLARVGLSPYFGFLHSTLPGKEPAVYDLQEFERTEMDRAVLDVLSLPSIQQDGFERSNDWTSRLARSTSRKVVEAVSEAFNRPVTNGTIEGRFYRESLALRSSVLGR